MADIEQLNRLKWSNKVDTVVETITNTHKNKAFVECKVNMSIICTIDMIIILIKYEYELGLLVIDPLLCMDYL